MSWREKERQILVDGWIAKHLLSDGFATLFLAISTGLVGYFDLFKESSSLYAAHGFAIKLIYTVTASVVPIIILARMRQKRLIKPPRGRAVADLLISLGSIVQWKSQRFRRSVPDIAKKNAFTTITQPEEQIRVIIQAANDYLAVHNNLKANCLDFTVLYSAGRKNDWAYLIKSDDNRRRTDPGKLMSEKSTASLAVETGQPQFVVSKLNAIEQGYYFQSAGDKGRDGSIYCHPVLSLGKFQFVVTVASYGCNFVDPNDKDSQVGTITALEEYCRRVELELILWVIKNIKKSPTRLRR